MTERPDLSDVSRRLQRLEDEAAITRLLARYGHCLDYGLEQEWVDCFTPEGVFDVRRANPPGATHRGHTELLAFARAHTRAPSHAHKHIVADSIIDLDGDAAHVVSYFLRVDRIDERPTLRTFGRYLDTLARTSDGWRFVERVAEIEARLVEKAPIG